MTARWPQDWHDPDGAADSYRGDVSPADSVVYDLYTEAEVAENILHSVGFRPAYDMDEAPVPVEDDLVPPVYELDSDHGYTVEAEVAGDEEIYAINIRERFGDTSVVWSFSTLEDLYQYLEDRDGMREFAQVIGDGEFGTIEEYDGLDRPALLDRARPG